jgi:dihydrofolate reductase
MAENRVIGSGNALPWRLPRDMKRFKHLTMGHTVVMGRTTYETLDGPLPGRRNVVLSRDPSRSYEGADVVTTLDEALSLAGDDDEVFVAGGAEIYRLALPRADRIYLTVVHAEVAGDTIFPPFDESEWDLQADERCDRDEHHAHAFSFRIYERR